MIVGDLPQFTAVSIGWDEDVNDAREDIAQAIERVRGEEGVLLLTDMFGGTPSNLGMTFLEKDRLEVITGVNLPMLIKLAGLRKSADLLAVAKEMRARVAGGRHELASLFDAQLLMLDDPMLVPRAAEIVRAQRVNAEWAVQQVLHEFNEV